MEPVKRKAITGGTLTDAPDHYAVTVADEGDSEPEWIFVRKPDGTYWDVVAFDFFHRTTLGKQIVDSDLLSLCEEYYEQSLPAETRTLKVLGMRKLLSTDPQQYALCLYDTAEQTRAYFLTTQFGTEEELRTLLTSGGLTEGQIELYFARAS